MPRHAARGDEIAAKLEALNLKIARRSKGEAITPVTDIYLADTMGELGLFYRLAPIAVVGGSFAAVGGHNPVEAAQLGCAIIIGSSVFNFAEITREFLFQRAAIQLQHANELGFTINRLFANPSELESLARNAKILADDKRHVLSDVMKELEPWLPKAAL